MRVRTEMGFRHVDYVVVSCVTLCLVFEFFFLKQCKVFL